MAGIDHPFLEPLRRGKRLALAHRGGALLPENAGIENTIAAFGHAVQRGYDYLETDVHASRDGVLYAFHDDTLERMAGIRAPIAEMLAHDIDGVRLAGREPIPRLREVLTTFDDARFSIDVKSDTAVEPLIELVKDQLERICLASFSVARLLRVRSALPGALTAFSPAEIRQLRLGVTRRSRAAGVGAGGRVVPAPLRRGAFPVVTKSFVRHAHTLDLPVLVWTIDHPGVMRRLLDMGVDGFYTDRPDILKDVLNERGQWPGAVQ